MCELEAFAGSCLLIAWRVQKPTGDYNVRDKMTREFHDLGNGVISLFPIGKAAVLSFVERSRSFFFHERALTTRISLSRSRVSLITTSPSNL